MAYRILLSAAIKRDLELIYDHLLQSYLALGDPAPEALARAVKRVAAIRSDINALSLTPHQGSLHLDTMPGLRHVTKNRAIFYFSVDDDAKIVRILAVFYGGQDHRRHILICLGNS